MVRSFCRAEDFQQITNIRENIDLVKFTRKPLMEAVRDDDGEPTGEHVNSGFVTYTEATIIGGVTPEKLIPIRLEEIDSYDVSDNVNSFTVNGKKLWFDKTTRTDISYSMNMEKAVGRTETTLYDNDGVAYVLPIDTAIQMFGALEIYAKDCYNKTQQHKVAVKALTTVQELLDYDITAGYPEKLSFEAPEAE